MRSGIIRTSLRRAERSGEGRAALQCHARRRQETRSCASFTDHGVAQPHANNRWSIEERYPTLIGYYFKALIEVEELVASRLLLPEDANHLVNQLLNDMLASGLLPKRAFIDLFSKRGDQAAGEATSGPDAAAARMLH